jgi:peptide chain release factor
MTNDNKHVCWLQITAGQGPAECELAVGKVLKRIVHEAQNHSLSTETLEAVSGEQPETFSSVLISVRGESIRNFTRQWQGTIQWNCESPYRPRHKRKNWFVGVNVLVPPQDSPLFKESDLRFETMRASGPGGQHVNKTDSAVRVIHLPTGLSATAREERSQRMNKELARTRLALMFEEQANRVKASKKQETWENHRQLERGNPVRVFCGKDFHPK